MIGSLPVTHHESSLQHSASLTTIVRIIDGANATAETVAIAILETGRSSGCRRAAGRRGTGTEPEAEVSVTNAVKAEDAMKLLMTENSANPWHKAPKWQSPPGMVSTIDTPRRSRKAPPTTPRHQPSHPARTQLMPRITQSQLNQYFTACSERAEATRRCHQLRDDLITRHNQGDTVEPGKLILDVNHHTATPITHAAIRAAYGEDGLQTILEAMPEVERIYVRVKQADDKTFKAPPNSKAVAAPKPSKPAGKAAKTKGSAWTTFEDWDGAHD